MWPKDALGGMRQKVWGEHPGVATYAAGKTCIHSSPFSPVEEGEEQPVPAELIFWNGRVVNNYNGQAVHQ